ncbi:hypothetical protein HNR60_000307 [Rhodopseudomonas rhenobacensis]|uniref:Uncharacterized protein n=1 Tax=Rhodopseudomonas rhenobacensis TaxID=87461 RepID=A0A7W7Z062_9BRAD|nr:hypothetical protein [Rhodopseudomonas rhenobacensis]MBB5045578.1 hypothetical protein [Rhodopseudomonas rhenobacensis]
MRTISAVRAAMDPPRIHPALRSFADDCRATLLHGLAYLAALALVTVIVFHAAQPFAATLLGEESAPAAKPGFVAATRSHPAFAVSQFDSSGKTETYEVLRHPDGGRKDVLRWAAPGEAPIAELEIYRPGTEASQGLPPAAELAARIDPNGLRPLEAAGLIDSKFGAVALFAVRDDDAGQPRACLGFLKTIAQPSLRISGWSCQGETQPARRAGISCLLNRLVLLSAGGDPTLAELFARAELRRGSCGAPSGPATADWVMGLQNPRLRGSL